MPIPESFVFNQHNLQNYVDCNRRFYLQEFARLEWPAIESEPVREQEALIALGTKFHLLCQQFFNGVPTEDLSEQIIDPDLQVWWTRFLELDFNAKDQDYLAEKLISIPFGGYRLAAKYDLLAINPDISYHIYDWKTSKHQPQRKYLVEKMQSKVYPLVLSILNSVKNPFDPEKVKMSYWYPEFPKTPIALNYLQSQLQADQFLLESLISEISTKQESDFRLTENEKLCSFCRYRSLCDRGIFAGNIESEELQQQTTDPFNFDFDQL
jgi:hypothetical protein